MRTVVEVGGWEHECCGPAYERDTVVEITCAARPGQGDSPARLVELRHGPEDPEVDTTDVRGRVADLVIEHSDGSTEQIARVPSGRALRGFDEHDHGHLEDPWTGERVHNDTNQFLITLES